MNIEKTSSAFFFAEASSSQPSSLAVREGHKRFQPAILKFLLDDS